LRPEHLCCANAANLYLGHIARHKKNGSGHRNDILSRSFFTNQILVIRFETVAADLQPAGC